MYQINIKHGGREILRLQGHHALDLQAVAEFMDTLYHSLERTYLLTGIGGWSYVPSFEQHSSHVADWWDNMERYDPMRKYIGHGDEFRERHGYDPADSSSTPTPDKPTA